VEAMEVEAMEVEAMEEEATEVEAVQVEAMEVEAAALAAAAAEEESTPLRTCFRSSTRQTTIFQPTSMACRCCCRGQSMRIYQCPLDTS